MPNNSIERFTDGAWSVLDKSHDEAKSLHHASTQAEHVLLALIREDSEIGGQVLSDAGVQYSQVRSLVEKLIKFSEPLDNELTASYKKVMVLAVGEARSRHQTSIGTEHLLMALTRQPESKAHAILKHLNVDPDDIYQRASALSIDRRVPFASAFPAIATIGFLCLAELEATELRSPSVEPEHLFLALLADADSSASRLMNELNLSLDRLRGMTQKIKRDLPVRQVEASGTTLIWSHDALRFVRAIPGYYPNPLSGELIRDWWVLSDLWRQALLDPKMVQAALNRAGIGITMRYPRHVGVAENMQYNLNFFVPPPLQRKLKAVWGSILRRFSGKGV